MITVERLKELFHYGPESGVFTRLVSLPSVRVGEIAGSLDGGRYRRIKIDGKRYQEHWLAWLYMTGTLPVAQIDHWNLNKADNRWLNLRAATNSQNQWNTRAPRTNTSGYKGVKWHKRERKWHACITVEGKRIYLGGFDTAINAHVAYCAAAKKYHGEYARAA